MPPDNHDEHVRHAHVHGDWLDDFVARRVRADRDMAPPKAGHGADCCGRALCVGEAQGQHCEITWRWANVCGIVVIENMVNVSSNVLVHDEDGEDANPAPLSSLARIIHGTGWQKAALQASRAADHVGEIHLEVGARRSLRI